jgi:hypothetical protein
VLLTAVILSEFGAAIYALVSRADFLDEMTKDMEESFSKYAKDKVVAENWKSLQKEVIIAPYLLSTLNYISLTIGARNTFCKPQACLTACVLYLIASLKR